MKEGNTPKHPLEMGAHKRFSEPQKAFLSPRGGHKTFNQIRRISPKH